MMPMQEKLKPLDKSLKKQTDTYSPRRYQVRDGRVIALEDEKPVVYEPEVSDTSTLSDNSLEQPALNASTDMQNSTPDVFEALPSIPAPQTAPIDNTLPSYKNRYALYLRDLDVFQRTKQMPVNPDLNATLSKVSAPHSEVLFDGPIQ